MTHRSFTFRESDRSSENFAESWLHVRPDGATRGSNVSFSSLTSFFCAAFFSSACFCSLVLSPVFSSFFSSFFCSLRSRSFSSSVRCRLYW